MEEAARVDDAADAGRAACGEKNVVRCQHETLPCTPSNREVSQPWHPALLHLEGRY